MSDLTFTQDQIEDIINEAKNAARQAATNYFHEILRGRDQYPCGFAWINIHGVKGTTKLGKMLKAAGLDKNYDGAFELYNPSGLPLQNVDAKERGAEAAALVFRKHGFRAYSASRLN